MSRTLDPNSDADLANEKDFFTFTLVIAGAPDASEELANQLYEAGCSDGVFGSSNGQLFMDFARESTSFAEAIRSAIENVESVSGLTVVKVLPGGAEVIRDANAYLRVRKKGSKSKFWQFLGKQ